MKKKNLEALNGIFCFLSWFFILNYTDILLSVIGINIDKLNIYLRLGINILLNITPIIIVYLIFKDSIHKMIKDFKKNNLNYFNKYFKYWFYILISMFISNLAIMLISGGDVANNQKFILDMFNDYPIYIFVLSVLLAPIIEELIFRFSYKKIFSNKYMYILMSGIVFGLFHVVGSYETLSDLLYIIPYSIPGIIFAYVYYESENIFVTIWLHFVHNGSSMLIQILLLLFNIEIGL